MKLLAPNFFSAIGAMLLLALAANAVNVAVDVSRIDYEPFAMTYSLIKEVQKGNTLQNCVQHIFLSEPSDPDPQTEPFLQGLRMMDLSVLQADALSNDFRPMQCGEGRFPYSMLSTTFKATGVSSDVPNCGIVGFELTGSLDANEDINLFIVIKFNSSGRQLECKYREGLFVSTSTPSPTPSPTKAPTPTPSPTPRPDGSTPTPTPTPAPSDSDDGSEDEDEDDDVEGEGDLNLTESGCFSAKSLISRKNEADGSLERVSLDSLRPGDLVESYDVSAGHRVFSPVVLIEHAGEIVSNVVKHVVLDSGEIFRATASHILRSPEGQYKHLGAFAVGDRLMTGDGTALKILDIYNKEERILNVLTLNDHVIVDGVVSSCYSRVDPFPMWMLRLVVAPLKLLHKAGLQNVVDKSASWAFIFYNGVRRSIAVNIFQLRSVA